MANRRIITAQLQSGGAKEAVDTYTNRLVKYIPGDVVAIWIAVTGLISGASDVPKTTLLWILFAIGVIFTVIWTLKQTTVKGTKSAITQILISTGAFIVWAIAFGGPFQSLSFYHAIYGSILLILYTPLVALISPKEA